METLSFKRSQESACCSKYSKGSISLLSQSVPGCFLYPIKTDLHLKSGTGKKNTIVCRETKKHQPEIWDAAGRADSCPGHHHHVLTATELHQTSHRGQTAPG